MMDESRVDIDRVSDELQRDADALLIASQLIPRLEKHGRVVIQGSYKYRLMTVPDIDLSVLSSRAGRDQAKSIVCDLIDQGFWRAYDLEDFVQFPYEDLPSGIYIGLRRVFRDRLWKVDIWNLVDIPCEVLCLDEAMAGITEAQRTAIMQIKHWRNSTDRKVASRYIYDAVLGGTANDVQSFRRLIDQR
jgi:hypothetical protein